VEAQRLRHDYIGTEHLLLGLILEVDGAAGKVLANMKVTIERAREELGNWSLPAPEPAKDRLPLTPPPRTGDPHRATAIAKVRPRLHRHRTSSPGPARSARRRRPDSHQPGINHPGIRRQILQMMNISEK